MRTLGALPEIEHLSIKRILAAFDDLVQLGFVKNRLGEINSLTNVLQHNESELSLQITY